MMIFLKLQSSTSRLVCDLCFATSNFKRWVFWSQRWLIHPDDNNEVDDLVQLKFGPAVTGQADVRGDNDQEVHDRYVWRPLFADWGRGVEVVSWRWSNALAH